MKKKHHDWQDHATRRTTEPALRAAARKWLVDNKLKDKVKPFEDSSWDNEDTVIAKFKRCGKCTWAMSFIKSKDWLVVRVAGEHAHEGGTDKTVIKQHLATRGILKPRYDLVSHIYIYMYKHMYT